MFKMRRTLVAMLRIFRRSSAGGNKAKLTADLGLEQTVALDAHVAPERGSVTAELAVALPAVVLLLITIIAMVAAFGTQIRVSDAARTGARLSALGYSPEVVHATMLELAGSGAEVSAVSSADGFVTVSVSRHLALGPASLGPFRLSGQASVWIEP